MKLTKPLVSPSEAQPRKPAPPPVYRPNVSLPQKPGRAPAPYRPNMPQANKTAQAKTKTVGAPPVYRPATVAPKLPPGFHPALIQRQANGMQRRSVLPPPVCSPVQQPLMPGPPIYRPNTTPGTTIVRYRGANPLTGGIVQPAALSWAQIAAGAGQAAQVPAQQAAQQPAQPPADVAVDDEEEEEEEEEYDPNYDPGPQARGDIDVRPSATTHYNDHDPAEALSWLSTDNQLKEEVIRSWGDADWDDDGECWIIYFGNRRVRQNGGGYSPRGCDIRVSFHEATWRYRVFHFGPTNAAG